MRSANLPDYHRGIPADAVAVLDPLHADKVCAQLPAMNGQADLTALIHALRSIVPAVERIRRFTPLECLAAMRDLGMFLGSIKRHGVQPVLAVPEVEAALLVLGTRTDLVPRDTVHHYACWNPRGARQRTYTGDPQETHLIDSVRHAMPRLEQAIKTCTRLVSLDARDPGLAAGLDTLAGQIQAMADAIEQVKVYVSPVYFARGLRPYFDAVSIAGHDYLGPAAANMPVALIDIALWASDHGNSAYAAFHRETIHYSLPPWRTLYHTWVDGPSLVRAIVATIATEGDPAHPALRAACQALCRVLRVLIVFRGKHLTIARRAYHEEVALYQHGSGGGSVELLAGILSLTRNIAAIVGPGHYHHAQSPHVTRYPVSVGDPSATSQGVSA